MVGGLFKRNFAESCTSEKSKRQKQVSVEKYDELAYIKEFLKANKIVLYKNQPIELEGEICDILLSIQSSLVETDILNKVLDGLKHIVSNDKILNFCLRPSMHILNGNLEDQIYEESLIHLLFTIKPIQLQLALFLINKLSNYKDLYPYNDAEKDEDAEFSIPLVILNECRQLESLESSEEFVKTYLDIFLKCEPDIKKEILTCLPEILWGHMEKPFVIDYLLKYLKSIDLEKPQELDLLSPLYNVLSNMNLNQIEIQKSFQNITLDIIPKLNSAKSYCYIKFPLKYLFESMQTMKCIETKFKNQSQELNKQNSTEYFILCFEIKKSFLKCQDFFSICQTSLNADPSYTKSFLSILETIQSALKSSNALAETIYIDLYHSLSANLQTTYDMFVWFLLYMSCPQLFNKILEGSCPMEFDEYYTHNGLLSKFVVNLEDIEFWTTFYTKYSFVVIKYLESWVNFCDAILNQNPIAKSQKFKCKSLSKDDKIPTNIVNVKSSFIHAYRALFDNLNTNDHKKIVLQNLIKNVLANNKCKKQYLMMIKSLFDGQTYINDPESTNKLNEDLWLLWEKLNGEDAKDICSLLYKIDEVGAEQLTDLSEMVTISLDTFCQTHPFYQKCMTNLIQHETENLNQLPLSLHGLLYNYQRFWLDKYFSNVNVQRLIILDQAWESDILTLKTFISNEIFQEKVQSELSLNMAQKIYSLDYISYHILNVHTSENMIQNSNTFRQKFAQQLFDFDLDHLMQMYTSKLSHPENPWINIQWDARGSITELNNSGIHNKNVAIRFCQPDGSLVKEIPLLVPIFRWVWRCFFIAKDCTNSNFEEMKELKFLLTCPLYMTDLEICLNSIFEPKSACENGDICVEKPDIHGLLSCTQNAINWFREEEVNSIIINANKSDVFIKTSKRFMVLQLLNAFSHVMESRGILKLLLTRLDHIIQLEQYLVQLLQQANKTRLEETYYTLEGLKRKVIADFSTNESDWLYQAFASHVSVKVKTGPAKSKKINNGKKSKKEDVEPCSDNEKNDKPTQTQSNISAPGIIKFQNPYEIPKLDVYIKRISSNRKYFRPLDNLTFDILCQSVVHQDADLKPSHVIFLLSELLFKVEGAFPTSNNPFAQVSMKNELCDRKDLNKQQMEACKTVTHLLPYVIWHSFNLLDPPNSVSSQASLYARYEGALIAAKIQLFHIRHYSAFQAPSHSEDNIEGNLAWADVFLENLCTSFLGTTETVGLKILEIVYEGSKEQPKESNDIRMLFDLWSYMASRSLSFILSEKYISLAYEFYGALTYLSQARENEKADNSFLDSVNYGRNHILEMCQTLLLSTDSKSLLLTEGKACERVEQYYFPSSSKGPFETSLAKVIKMYFEMSTSSLELLEDMALNKLALYIEAQTPSVDQSAEQLFPTLNNAFLPIYYDAMLKELIKISKENRSKGVEYPEGEVLRKWNLCVQIFHVLIDLIKINDVKAILVAGMKHGRSFVESFYSNALPYLENLFKIHTQDICNLLRNLQKSTRYLHSVCAHAKKTKDVTLLKHVPALKRTLETFIYKVKGMLAKNDCQSAFWLGDLKNRNLQGIEISSQIQTQKMDET